jgi:hypothetical protein
MIRAGLLERSLFALRKESRRIYIVYIYIYIYITCIHRRVVLSHLLIRPSALQDKTDRKTPPYLKLRASRQFPFLITPVDLNFANLARGGTPAMIHPSSQLP